MAHVFSSLSRVPMEAAPVPTSMIAARTQRQSGLAATPERDFPSMLKEKVAPPAGTSAPVSLNFMSVFNSPPAVTADSVPADPQQRPVPTVESVFGPNPWISNPTGIGPNGQQFSYNKWYFATAETAAKVAEMAGGTVVEANVFTPNGGGFSEQQPNYMVKLGDGRLINPGLVASFYAYGHTQAYIDQMLAKEFSG